MLHIKSRYCYLTALCLFAATASVQARLLITFSEDPANGQFNVAFSGSTISPMNFPLAASYGGFQLGEVGGVFIAFGSDQYTSFGGGGGWASSGLPFLENYANFVVGSGSGTGGYQFNNGQLNVYAKSATRPTNGDLIIWDGHATFEGTLANIGLVAGDSGVLSFTKDDDMLNIYWEVAVPEPATYALVLAVGIAGVALLRRRAR